jgi:hypothetical protein
MIDHPVIRNAQAAFDEIEGKMSELYILAKEADLDQKFVDNFNAQVNAWNEAYLRMFAAVRKATSEEEFLNSKTRALSLMEEGLSLHEDFRIVCLAKIQNDLGRLRADKRKADQEEALEWQQRPVRSFLLYKVMFPVFDCLDWILQKTRGRGLGK